MTDVAGTPHVLTISGAIMTQLTFEFSATASVTPVIAPVASREETHRELNESVAGQAYRSLPLYDARQGELHHAGDLARAVLARYELVHRRRAARLRREALARSAG